MGDEEDDVPQMAKIWLEDLSNGITSQGLESLSLHGLKVVHVQKGLIRCDFTIPENLADKDGKWQAGAMAVLIDDVGAAAIFSHVGHVKASVSFTISYYSIPKIQEEVTIEAKLVGQLGKLADVLVEIRRKDNGELVALGKQWMSQTGLIPSIDQNGIPSNQVSSSNSKSSL